jgi:hypothetical protein
MKILRMTPETILTLYEQHSLTPEMLRKKAVSLLGEEVELRYIQHDGSCDLMEGEEDALLHVSYEGVITLKELENGKR